MIYLEKKKSVENWNFELLEIPICLFLLIHIAVVLLSRSLIIHLLRTITHEIEEARKCSLDMSLPPLVHMKLKKLPTLS